MSGTPMERDELQRRCEHLEQQVNDRTTELMASNERLQQEIAARKRLEDQLKHAQHDIETASHVKSNFLARMSHELRTPLNAIIGMGHLALQTELTTKQHDYLHKIHSSAHSLLEILNDILDFSKIESGKLTIKSNDFNLEDVLNALSNQESAKAQKKGLELMFAISADVPRFLIGDPLRLGQILTNLVNNAIKFTQEGEIVVTTELIPDSPVDTGDVLLRFSVRDTGIGIPQDIISTLFGSFSQADSSSTRKYGGTGLGLAICQRLVQLMDGDIHIESEAGKGSTFIFTAKFGTQSEKHDTYLMPLPDVRGLRVLVVDDNATAREILSHTLTSLSFDVNQAASGQEALTELEQTSEDNPYDVVLMDWKMPEMDGIQASRRIKKEGQLPHIPAILMVTAYDKDEVAHEAEDVGIDAFLTKPVNPSMLFDTVMDVMGKKLPGESRRLLPLSESRRVAQQLQGAHILLVEDNTINQQVATEILENAGVKVTVANNGQEAAERLMIGEWRLTIDAVLMDIQMPYMDGYEATRTIREIESECPHQQSPIPIIAMTAHAMSGEREKCLEAGMNDYVTKPIDPEVLLATLGKWIAPKEEPIMPAARRRREERTSQDDLPERLPGLDLETGLKRIGGDKKFFKKLLLEFQEDYATSAHIIREAMQEENMEYAQRTAHTIKGIAGNIGADDLYLSASELELAFKQEKREVLETLVNNFEVALSQVIHSITSLSSSAAPSNDSERAFLDETQIDVARMKSLLHELANLLKAYDSEAEDHLDPIRQHLSGSQFYEQFSLLDEQVSNFDFEDALTTLAELARSMNIVLEDA